MWIFTLFVHVISGNSYKIIIVQNQLWPWFSSVYIGLKSLGNDVSWQNVILQVLLPLDSLYVVVLSGEIFDTTLLTLFS